MKGRDHLDELGVSERIILKQILEKQGERIWTRFISGSGLGPVADSFENGNEPWG